MASWRSHAPKGHWLAPGLLGQVKHLTQAFLVFAVLAIVQIVRPNLCYEIGHVVADS